MIQPFWRYISKSYSLCPSLLIPEEKALVASRGLLCDCEIFANLRLTFVSSSTQVPCSHTENVQKDPAFTNKPHGLWTLLYAHHPQAYCWTKNEMAGPYNPMTFYTRLKADIFLLTLARRMSQKRGSAVWCAGRGAV